MRRSAESLACLWCGRYFDLVTETPLEWDKMGSEADGFLYDEVVVGGGNGEPVKKYNLRAGAAAYIEELVSHFPEEREAIEKWCERLSSHIGSPPPLFHRWGRLSSHMQPASPFSQGGAGDQGGEEGSVL